MTRSFAFLPVVLAGVLAAQSFEEEFRRGLLALSGDDLTQARQSLENASRAKPDNAMVWRSEERGEGSRCSSDVCSSDLVRGGVPPGPVGAERRRSDAGPAESGKRIPREAGQCHGVGGAGANLSAHPRDRSGQ